MKKIFIFPESVWGRLSVGSAILFFLFLSLFYSICALGQRGGETFFSNLYLAIPILLAAISGVAAFFSGLISIFKKKDYSVLIFLSTLIGFFVLFWFMAEIVSSH